MIYIKSWIVCGTIIVIILIVSTITLHDSTLMVSECIVSADENIVVVADVKEDVKTYTDEELNMLSRIIFAEAGSDWITDEHQLAVGSVVLNRMADSRFPNTMRDVIFQEGQYTCTWDGNYYKDPNERAVNNAKYLLENGVTIPNNVVWQSQGKQGKGLWKKIQNHYFCY